MSEKTTNDQIGKVNDMSDVEHDKDTAMNPAEAGAAADTAEPQTRQEDDVEEAVATDSAETTVPDSVQFSIVFDDDADDESSVLDSIAIDTETASTDGEGGTGNTADDAASNETTRNDASTSQDSAEPVTVDADADDDESSDHGTDVPAASDSAESNGTESNGTTEADTDDENTTAAEVNANRVNETLKLGVKAGKNADALTKAAAAGASSDPALRLSSRIDKELGKGNKIADEILLKSYPTFSLNKVTVTDRKTGRNVLDRINATFYTGHVYALLLPEGDAAMHETLMAMMSGVMRPNDGYVMNKSANLLELEPNDLRGHRLGIIPQRYAVREDLNAERNIVYAMDASGRTFLKPKPVLARELLQRVKFDVDTPNAQVGKLDAVDQRRVAVARAIACEAEVLIADEPTGGLNDDDSVAILQLLTSLTHGDPKRCVIILTESEAVANTAEKVIEL